VYKILMNSLYGRFGINPISTTGEICNEQRKDELLHLPGFSAALGDNKWLCHYLNSTNQKGSPFSLPRNAALQISAAVHYIV
jgi:hypothetical protein